MKKILYSLLVLTMTAFTFTSCEDVPEPYALPTENGNSGQDEPAADPAGSGTAADPYNVAAAQDLISKLGADVNSDEIYVKGIVSQVDEISTSYGNATYYISDTGKTAHQLEVYRGYGLNGDKFTSADDLKVGDEVIVKGKVVNFRGNTPEFTQGSSLYYLNGKTAGGGGGGGDQPAGEAKGDGTLENPFNAVAANAFTSALAADAESDRDVYIKGKIAKIANNGEFNAQYGNATFYISDDGNDANTFYVFRTLYLNNKKWADGDKQIQVGDEVIICGRVVNYRGNTPETVQNKSYIYSHNSSGGGTTPDPGSDPTPTEGTGDGSLNNPFNSVAANSVANQLGSDQKTNNSYYIKGKIAKIANNGEFNTQYGNASFYISDDGSDNNSFYVFRTLYLGNRKWAEGDTQIKVGDEVIVCAKLTNYKGNTPETVQGETYLYSLNNNTGEGGGGDVSSKGSYEDPYDVTTAITAGDATGVYLKGYIVGYVEGQEYANGAHFDASGDNVSATNILLAASASETNAAACMPIQLPKGEIRSGLNLKDNPGNLGKEVLLYGDLAAYFSVPGFKNTSYAEINGKSIGTKASPKKKVRR